MLPDFIRHKIESYKIKLKAFEQKYHMTFSDFSKKLKKGASIAEEDEWMEWEAAKNMLKAWKQAAKETDRIYRIDRISSSCESCYPVYIIAFPDNDTYRASQTPKPMDYSQ